MRIAFASCMCTRVFRDQPVWDQIAALAPDYLVLLGDSIYLDINVKLMPQHPEQMDVDTFGQHIFSLYQELIRHPQFSRLVRQLPPERVFSIWDDHDFLWNDMYGAAAKANPVQRDKVPVTTAFQKMFRRALALGLAPDSFPKRYDDPAFWDRAEPTLATPSVSLGGDVWLHLLDDRSFRTAANHGDAGARTLLGSAQRAQIGAAIEVAPDAVHLLASGSVVADWQPYASDWQWLMQLAANHRTMVLSGDIHRNNVALFQTAGLPLHEVTSSGAAVRALVVAGDEQQNFGYIDIDDSKLQTRLFHYGLQQAAFDRSIGRNSWQRI